jgi:hypothetical protein
MKNVWLAALLIVSGCENANNDADAGMDMGALDLAVGLPDLRIPIIANGDRLLSGRVSLVGVTSDDFVVGQTATGEVSAVPATGGSPQQVSPMADDGLVGVIGKSVFAWSGVDQNTGVGVLTLWSDAAKVQTLGNTSPVSLIAATEDGTYVLYFDNADATGDIADVWVAKNDGTGKIKVLTAQRAFTPCRPRGGASGNKFVVVSCTQTGDAGPMLAQLSTIDPSNGQVTPATTPELRSFVAPDKTGTHALVVDSTGKLHFVTLASGAATLIDNGPVVGAVFINSGADVLYNTMAGALKRATVVATPVVTTLVATGAVGIDAISPDENWVAYHTVYDAQSFMQDLYFVSTAVAGAPRMATTISSNVDVGVYGDVFTTDSSRIIYFSDLDDNAAGHINTLPVAGGGGTPTKLTTNKGWVALAGAGSRVIFNDAWKSVMNQPGRADLYTVDQGGGTNNLISVQADDAPSLNTAKNRVIYTYRVDTAKAGLYSAPLQ